MKFLYIFLLMFVVNTIQARTVTLLWGYDEGVLAHGGFTLERRDSAGGEFKPVNAGLDRDARTFIADLPEGMYQYRLRAFGQQDVSVVSIWMETALFPVDQEVVPFAGPNNVTIIIN